MLRRLALGSLVAAAAGLGVNMVSAEPAEADVFLKYEWTWSVRDGGGMCWNGWCQVVRGQGSCCIITIRAQ